MANNYFSTAAIVPGRDQGGSPMPRNDSMPGNINDFVAQFGDSGVAKANRYRLEFNLPPGIQQDASAFFINTDSANSRIQGLQNELNRTGGINMMCHTATLPSRELQTFELGQYGPPHSMPQTASYMPVSFGFYSNGNLDTRRFFEVWQTAVHNISSNTFNFYNEYVSDIKIFTLDTSGQDRYMVEIYEAWPMSIMQVDYSYSNNDTAQTFMVAFRYKYWQAKHDDTRPTRTV